MVLIFNHLHFFHDIKLRFFNNFKYIYFILYSHMCMVMRGVEKAGTTTVSNTFLGSFETDKQARSEYFSMIK